MRNLLTLALMLFITPVWAATATLPSGWRSVDIGGRGSSSESGGTFTVKGNNHFCYQQQSGNFTFIAKLQTADTRAGIRVSPGLAGDGPRCEWTVDPKSTKNNLRRDGYFGAKGNCRDWRDHTISAPVPQWLRVERYGRNVRCSTSGDGVNWNFFQGPGMTLDMDGTANVGLLVEDGTATFNSVSVSAFQPEYTTTWAGTSFATSYAGGGIPAGEGGLAFFAVEPATNGIIVLGGLTEALDFIALDQSGSSHKAFQNSHCAGPVAVDSSQIYCVEDTGWPTSKDGHGYYVVIFAHDVGTYRKDCCVALGTNVCAGLVSTGPSTHLYLSDATANKIRSFDNNEAHARDNPKDAHRKPLPEGPSFDFARPGAMALDGSGNLRIVQSPDAAHTAKILHYSTAGSPLGGVIDLSGGNFPHPVQPAGLAVQPGSGRIWVADKGRNSCIWIFNSDGSFNGRFGDLQGIYSGTPGATGDLKFNMPRGVQFDAEGNIYVLSAPDKGVGLSLKKFNGSSVLQWQRYANEFVDCADADPGSDGVDLYTAFHHYVIDYSKPAGQDVTHKGYTLDPYTYAGDPRTSKAFNGATVRRISGKRFLYVLQWPREGLQIYRFTDRSEIAIPCGAFRNDYQWIDSNGNGQVDEPATKGVPGGGELDGGSRRWHVDHGREQHRLLQMHRFERARRTALSPLPEQNLH